MRVSELLGHQLASITDDVRAAVPRLDDGRDVEAVHDFRVALRRLRSLLRPARSVYGRFHTDAVRAALKRVADATGTLRDEEVLEETLAALPLSARAAVARDAWIVRRAPRRRALRAALLRVVKSGGVTDALRLMDALLALPVRKGRDPDAATFALDVVFAAERAVHANTEVHEHDVDGLHALRILYKRLRYAVDGFEQALSPEVLAIAPVAAKFQKRLGEVHDLDVAKVSIGRARSLDPSTRAELLAKIAATRAACVVRYEAEKQRGATKPRAATPLDAPVKKVRAATPRRAQARSR